MRNLYTQDAQQAALGFLIRQATHIESQVYRVRYPEIQYPELIPVDTSANDWAKSVTFFSMDRVGRADWFNHMARDIPLADVTREKFEHGIEMAGVGYRYTLEEIGHAMLIPGTNLTTEKADAARRAYEEFMDDVALRGNTVKGWTGLINDANVTSALAAADGNGSSPAWDEKTADQVLRDVNAVITGMYTATLTTEIADTLLLPIEAYTSIATRRIPDTTMTILEFLMKYNVFTAQTKRQLEIRAVRGLEVAGAGGTGRMVAYRRDPQVLKLHLPMPHRFLPVMHVAPLTYDVPGIFRTGGVEIRRPSAVRYVDGITDAPYE